MFILMAGCCLIVLVSYTVVSVATADGLPVFRDWHYWTGLPIVLAVGVAAGWLLSGVL